MIALALAGTCASQPLASEGSPSLTKLPGTIETSNTMETTPILYHGQQFLLENYRDDNTASLYQRLKNLTTGGYSTAFGNGFSLGCAYVNGDQINVFASKATSDWFSDIYRFTSTNGVDWSAPTLAVPRSNEHLLNSSVCKDNQGYIMAYESDNPVGFCFKFARSTDLATWTKLDVPTFAGPKGNEYSACPMIRYSGDYYYTLYLAQAQLADGQNGYVTKIARSKDLATWEYGLTPVLVPSEGEGINNSDVDMFEIDNKTYLYYAIGDQQTWCHVKKAVYDGPMSEFLAGYFPAHAPEPSAWVLLTTGLLGLLTYAWRKRNSGKNC